jgi:hypothetical protein
VRKLFAVLWVVVCLAISGTRPHAQQSAEEAKRAEEARAADQAEVAKRAAEARAADQAARAAAQAADAARIKVVQEEQRRAVELERQRIAKADEVIPVDVEVVISRYQGDKKVSSLPYALTVNAKDTPEQFRPLTQLRMGGRVPLPSMAPATGPDGKSLFGFSGGGPVQYEDVGTSIDARARPMGDSRFELTVMVEDSGVAMPQGSAPGGTTLPVIRTFRSSNNLVLRDGQTRQFTAASDRITGEVVRVDVTLKVVK